jgi:DNA repair protein RadD
MELRPYQLEIMQQLRTSQQKRVMVQAPTGTGKGWLIAHLAVAHSKRGRNVQILSHRNIILGDIRDRIASLSPDRNIHIHNIATVRRRKKHPRPDVLIIDEAHSAASNGYHDTINTWLPDYSYGFSATPTRLDGRPLTPYYDDLIISPSVRWFIEQKYLSDYEAYGIPLLERRSVRTQMGDFNQEDVAEKIHGNPIEHWLKYAKDTQTIVFCPNIAFADKLAKCFQELGCGAGVIHSKLGERRIAETIDLFKSHALTILLAVDMVSEGFDVPGIETVVLLRPTKSLMIFLQQVGRGLRPKPDGRPCLILDHVGNIEAHGLPCLPRAWTLEGTPKKRKEAEDTEPMPWACDGCLRYNAPDDDICQHCGQAKEVSKATRGERQIDHEAQLERYDITTQAHQKPEPSPWMKSMSRAKYEEIVKYGRIKGKDRMYAWKLCAKVMPLYGIQYQLPAYPARVKIEEQYYGQKVQRKA